MEIVLFILAGYVTMAVTWFFYVGCMHMIRFKDQMHPIAKAHAYVFIICGLILDFFLNIIFATVFLLDFPREWLLTQRLQRLKRGKVGWRKTVAIWICRHLLNQFDPGHC